MRLYHFLNKEYALKDIEFRRLKIAEIQELNDPFEYMAPVMRDAAIRAAFERTKQQSSQMHGMLCFSRSWKNPVMWTHYADRHRGLCLGFDVSDEFTLPVRYSKVRLDIDFAHLLNEGRHDEAQEGMTQVISTKFDHWEYEDEVRVGFQIDKKTRENGLLFAEFSENISLKEIILGVNSDVTQNELIGALGDHFPNVDIWPVRLSNGSFEMIR